MRSIESMVEMALNKLDAMSRQDFIAFYRRHGYDPLEQVSYARVQLIPQVDDFNNCVTCNVVSAEGEASAFQSFYMPVDLANVDDACSTDPFANDACYLCNAA